LAAWTLSVQTGQSTVDVGVISFCSTLRDG
jgi:hypothetical protein